MSTPIQNLWIPRERPPHLLLVCLFTVALQATQLAFFPPLHPLSPAHAQTHRAIKAPSNVHDERHVVVLPAVHQYDRAALAVACGMPCAARSVYCPTVRRTTVRRHDGISEACCAPRNAKQSKDMRCGAVRCGAVRCGA
eukprot:189763-Chlamydomonas_euryale.AAC.1